MLTINRASAAYLGCLQQRTAFFTGLATSAVHQQMILVIALISFAVLIITEGCTAIFDALRDYRIDCLTQAPYLSSAQAAGFAAWAECLTEPGIHRHRYYQDRR